MQVKPAPHSREPVGGLRDVHHRSEVDAFVTNWVVPDALGLKRLLARAPRKEDVHLARRHARSAQVGE